MAAQIRASTQKFTEIEDIVDNIVLFSGRYACMVIELTASNFALLSKQEQDTKLFSYASLLNSLTFSIQILIRNERVDITSYIKALEEAERNTQNPLLKKHVELYRNFVKEMVLVNTVLNKKFYIVLGFNSLEAGPGGLRTNKREDFISVAKKILQSKADGLHPQLLKIATSAKILEKEELVKLFYDIYNHEVIDATSAIADVSNPVVETQK